MSKYRLVCCHWKVLYEFYSCKRQLNNELIWGEFRYSQAKPDKFAGVFNAIPFKPLKSLKLVEVDITTELLSNLSRHGATLKELCLRTTASVLSQVHQLDFPSLHIIWLCCTPAFDSITLESLPELALWLRKCKKLRKLSFVDCKFGSSVVEDVLKDRSVLLRSLQLDSNVLHQFRSNLLRPLESCTTLEELYLTTSVFRDVELDDLIQSICRLKSLRILRLSNNPNFLTEEHISNITNLLPNLESLGIGQMNLTQFAWRALSRLSKLRFLSLSGTCRFKIDDVLGFILNLSAENRGFHLNIDLEKTRSEFPSEQLFWSPAKALIERNIGGRLEVTHHSWLGGSFLISLLSMPGI